MHPNEVVWCDGSLREYEELADKMVATGIAVRLNQKLRPNSLLFRSDKSDVARVEDRTFIACKNQADAGPTNNWMEPQALKKTMMELYHGCMKGRTMYVIPFCMGPVGSPMSKLGVEITDSEYVVLNMHIMTRVGTSILKLIGETGNFVPMVHSVGKPL